MHVATELTKATSKIEGVEQWPFIAAASVFEVIPRTLAQNCGCNVIRVVTELRSKHAEDIKYAAFLGIEGKIADMRMTKVWEPLSVKKKLLRLLLSLLLCC